MRVKLAAGAGRTQPLWMFLVPGVLAFVLALLLAVVDAGGMIMGSWDTPVPGRAHPLDE